jgi:hypothetical protein
MSAARAATASAVSSVKLFAWPSSSSRKRAASATSASIAFAWAGLIAPGASGAHTPRRFVSSTSHSPRTSPPTTIVRAARCVASAIRCGRSVPQGLSAIAWCSGAVTTPGPPWKTR